MGITRTPMIDDDGSGQSGTVVNNSWKSELYDQIDAALGPAAAIPAPGAAGNVMTSTGAAWVSQPSPQGIWTVVPFNAANFKVLTGSGTWVVTQTAENSYARINGVLHWALYVPWFSAASTLTGTNVTGLGVTIPAGLWATRAMTARLGWFSNGNGAFVDVIASTSQGSPDVTLGAVNGAPFLPGANLGFYTMLTLGV